MFFLLIFDKMSYLCSQIKLQQAISNRNKHGADDSLCFASIIKWGEGLPKLLIRFHLDICTGSGCIAITLGLNIPNSEVTGWDISEDALRIAQGNVEMMKAGNVRIEHQDALALPKAAETDNEKMKGNDDKEVVKPKGEAKTPSTQKWDLIVSNPPYICEKEKADMEKNVLEHEPSLALFVPDEDPLKFYRAIAEYASSALKSGGALYFEINPIYEKETREMLLKLDFKDIETKEDAFGKKRMMRAIK